jgi:hypothetical protein
MIRRRISPGLVDHWFRPVKKGERTSLGARCAVTMDKEQVERVRRLVHARLDNNDFPWKTVTAFLKITNASS